MPIKYIHVLFSIWNQQKKAKKNISELNDIMIFDNKFLAY